MSLSALLAVATVLGTCWQANAGTVEFQWHADAKREVECESSTNPKFKFPIYTRGPEACTKLMGFKEPMKLVFENWTASQTETYWMSKEAAFAGTAFGPPKPGAWWRPDFGVNGYFLHFAFTKWEKEDKKCEGEPKIAERAEGEINPFRQYCDRCFKTPPDWLKGKGHLRFNCVTHSQENKLAGKPANYTWVQGEAGAYRPPPPPKLKCASRKGTTSSLLESGNKSGRTWLTIFITLGFQLITYLFIALLYSKYTTYDPPARLHDWRSRPNQKSLHIAHLCFYSITFVGNLVQMFVVDFIKLTIKVDPDDDDSYIRFTTGTWQWFIEYNLPSPISDSTYQSYYMDVDCCMPMDLGTMRIFINDAPPDGSCFLNRFAQSTMVTEAVYGITAFIMLLFSTVSQTGGKSAFMARVVHAFCTVFAILAAFCTYVSTETTKTYKRKQEAKKERKRGEEKEDDNGENSTVKPQMEIIFGWTFIFFIGCLFAKVLDTAVLIFELLTARKYSQEDPRERCEKQLLRAYFAHYRINVPIERLYNSQIGKWNDFWPRVYKRIGKSPADPEDQRHKLKVFYTELAPEKIESLDQALYDFYGEYELMWFKLFEIYGGPEGIYQTNADDDHSDPVPILEVVDETYAEYIRRTTGASDAATCGGRIGAPTQFMTPEIIPYNELELDMDAMKKNKQ